MTGLSIFTQPMWGFFLMSLIITGAPILLGLWFGHRRLARAKDAGDEAAPLITGTVLTMLGFILAFTFSMAASRFEDRRQVVLEEANAIGTAYLRADLLPEPARSTSALLLKQYAVLRLAAASARNMAELDGLISQSTEIQSDLWVQATAAATQTPSAITGLYITSLNGVIDAHGKRILYSLRSSIPTMIWVNLFVLTAVALIPLGYQASSSPSYRTTLFSLALALAIVFTLIGDLDNPGKGFLKANQTPLIDLVATIAPDGLPPAK